MSEVPVWRKGRNLPPRPSGATCPACHLITTDRHCSSPACDWFVCREHKAVIGVIGTSRTFWLRRPTQG